MMKVRRITESNRLLTEQSLRYVHDFFEVLTGGNTGANTYGRSGRQDDQPGRLMIDQVV